MTDEPWEMIEIEQLVCVCERVCKFIHRPAFSIGFILWVNSCAVDASAKIHVLCANSGSLQSQNRLQNVWYPALVGNQQCLFGGKFFLLSRLRAKIQSNPIQWKLWSSCLPPKMTLLLITHPLTVGLSSLLLGCALFVFPFCSFPPILPHNQYPMMLLVENEARSEERECN